MIPAPAEAGKSIRNVVGRKTAGASQIYLTGACAYTRDPPDTEKVRDLLISDCGNSSICREMLKADGVLGEDLVCQLRASGESTEFGARDKPSILCDVLWFGCTWWQSLHVV
jgi:hypothetical protein